MVETVKTEAAGKLNVSGQARPCVVLQLYLNDSLVASVTAGKNRRFAATINEGVTPRSYRVELDEKESNSGAVRGRAEVPFRVLYMTTAAGPAQAADETMTP